MATLRTTFEFQIDINFTDKERANHFFIESDWKEHFYEFNDLDEVSEHLAINFDNASEQWEDGQHWKHIDGFGSYYYHREEKEWRLTKDMLKEGEELPCGEIVIKYEMNTECTDVTELN